mgnify:CR=1 FL=1
MQTRPPAGALMKRHEVDRRRLHAVVGLHIKEDLYLPYVHSTLSMLRGVHVEVPKIALFSAALRCMMVIRQTPFVMLKEYGFMRAIVAASGMSLTPHSAFTTN